MNDVLSEYRAGDSCDRAEQMLVVCDWSVCGSMGVCWFVVLAESVGRRDSLMGWVPARRAKRGDSGRDLWFFRFAAMFVLRAALCAGYKG